MSFTALDCSAKAVLVLLPDIADVSKVGDCSDLFKVTVLLCLLEVVFKLIVLVKMVLKGSLVPSCDYDDILNS